MNREEITTDHLISDIQQLALEVNNIAVTLSALIEILNVDKAKLRDKAKEVFNSAIASNQEAEELKEEDKEEDAREDLDIRIEMGGESDHPKGAIFFGED
tara:strand:+ start:83 stop:382 length:300 start_codon:yes stop_codon:yes gene_type:complete